MEKARKKLRLTIEMDIDTDEYPNLTAKEVEQSVILQDSDAIDGFEITMCHPDLDNTSDFVLSNGVIVQKELISELQTEEIDYKQAVIDSVDKEYKVYEAELLKGTAETAYCHSYETTIKTVLCEGICGEVELGDNVYKALYQKRGEILADMHTVFIGDLTANLFDKKGVKRFVEEYCEQEYPEIMNESSAQMGMG